MNPWLIIAAGIFWVVSVGGAYVRGQMVGGDRVIAKQASVNDAIEKTREAAQQGAAAAIAGMKPINTTIYQKATHEIRTQTVYADCRHSDGMRSRIDSALTGRP